LGAASSRRQVTRHAAIVGSTGSGKSNSVAALLKSLTAGAYPSAQVVVIDPHGEYGRALSKVFRIGGPGERRRSRAIATCAFKPFGMGNAAPFKPQPPPIMMSYVSRMANRLRDRRFDFMLNPGPYDGTNRDLNDLVADGCVGHVSGAVKSPQMPRSTAIRTVS
jgi:hypothetical protein